MSTTTATNAFGEENKYMGKVKTTDMENVWMKPIFI
jgi:hypothetical protein